MNSTTIHVGLDVHKKTTAVAVSQGPGRARFIGTIDSNPCALLKVLGKLGDAQEMSVGTRRDRRGDALVITRLDRLASSYSGSWPRSRSLKPISGKSARRKESRVCGDISSSKRYN